MTRTEITEASASFIRDELRRRLPPGTAVYLFGSRARGTARWNSDFDLWVDADIADGVIAGILEDIEESFVPFKVDIVTTPRLRGEFGRRVRGEARLWM